MTGFICHDDYLNKTAILSDEQLGRLLRACMKYHATGEIEQLDGVEGMAFEFIRFDIDKAEDAYKTKCEKNRQNRLSKQSNVDERKEPTTNDNDCERSTPKQNKTRHIKDNTKQTSPFFDLFWSAYPRHTDKQGAMRAFDKAKIDEDLLSVILAAIERQKASDQWTKDNGQYIPHPATWLNHKRWEDETQPVCKPKVVAQDFPQRDYSSVQGEMMSDLAREIAEMKAREGA